MFWLSKCLYWVNSFNGGSSSSSDCFFYFSYFKDSTIICFYFWKEKKNYYVFIWKENIRKMCCSIRPLYGSGGIMFNYLVEQVGFDWFYYTNEVIEQFDKWASS